MKAFDLFIDHPFRDFDLAFKSGDILVNTVTIKIAEFFGEIAVIGSCVEDGEEQLYFAFFPQFFLDLCGGGIKGNRLDLYFGTTEECISFGVRDCTVYFLTD